MDKQYVVGIDFGHGETAAWIVPLVKGTSIEEGGESLVLKKANKDNERVLPSVIYLDKRGNYSIERPQGAVILTELKGRPKSLPPRKQEAYSAFIKCVVERLLSANHTLLRKDNDGDYNFFLCVACPTRWDDTDKSEYITFINQSLSELGIEVLWVINESDAAYFTHRPDKNSPDKRVLVIDHGSSTIDYTVMEDSQKVSDDKWSNPHLGASNIETAIIQNYEGKNYESYQRNMEGHLRTLQATGNGHITEQNIKDDLKDKCRRGKEICFTESHYPLLNTIYFSMAPFVGANSDNDPFEPYLFSIKGNLENMIQSYISEVEIDFRQLKEHIDVVLNNQPIDRFILSGGACIMDWVEPLVEKVFGTTDAKIVKDTKPAYVVARGIALYAVEQFYALKNLTEKVRQIDFGSIYKKADSDATIIAIEQLIPTVVNTITNKSGMTGDDIRTSFCNFVRGLNENNYTFSQYVQQSLDSSISSAVSKEVKDVIYDVFHVVKDTSDISLHVDAVIMAFADSVFEPGGGFYNMVTHWIEESSGRFSFTWDRPREESERSKIANGTAGMFLKYMKEENPVTYPDVSPIAEIIRLQAVESSIDIFYKKQLFKTTFASN